MQVMLAREPLARAALVTSVKNALAYKFHCTELSTGQVRASPYLGSIERPVVAQPRLFRNFSICITPPEAPLWKFSGETPLMNHCVNEHNEPLSSATYGPIDHRQTDRQALISFVPFPSAKQPLISLFTKNQARFAKK